MAVSTPALEAEGLYRFFHVGDSETVALAGVSMRAEPGEFCVLAGPSGSGKSTLIACLAGLDDPDGGAVRIMGERVSRRSEAAKARLRARHLGLFLQSGNLLDHLSVRDNLRLALALAKRDPAAADATLAALEVGDLADVPPAALSGGQAGLAGLAVALCTEPSVIVCDEPTAEVDAVTEARMIDLLRATCGQGRTVLVATHSTALQAVADRVIQMRDGRLDG